MAVVKGEQDSWQLTGTSVDSVAWVLMLMTSWIFTEAGQEMKKSGGTTSNITEWLATVGREVIEIRRGIGIL